MTAEWRITGKSVGSRNDVLVNVTYGTERANGFKILEEDTLNLKDVRIYDIIEENGKQKRVLNKRETTLAQQKQQANKGSVSRLDLERCKTKGAFDSNIQ